MRIHDEPEQLSAYLDGELDEITAAETEVHLETCAECRETLSALRAAVVDLRALGDPEPSPLESRALRAAVLRARLEPEIARSRALQALAAVAASIVAVFAFTVDGAQRDADVSAAARERAVPIVLLTTAVDYSASSADTRLAALAGDAFFDGAGGKRGPDALTLPRRVAAGGFVPPPVPANHDERRRACERIMFASRPPGTPYLYEAAQYEGLPALLLVYEVPDATGTRLHLWVVAEDDCRTLYRADRPR